MRLVPLAQFKDVTKAIRGRKKLACLDVGTKSVGIALSDETLRFAFPFDTFLRVDSANIDKRMDPEVILAASKYFQNLTDKENIGAYIVGLPLYQGRVTPLCREIIKFSSSLSIKLHERQEVWGTVWDESYSTSNARYLTKNMTSKLNVKLKRKDMMAASIILEDFLSNNLDDGDGEL